jgi:uncharacterized repeat protein (TIGR04042 family)
MRSLSEMPEVWFKIQLPDGVTKACYSPSSVVRKHFSQGEEMSVAEFLVRSREALTAASNRVFARRGFRCSAVIAQLESIQKWTSEYASDATVRILHI